MKKVTNVIKWIISIFFLLFGLVTFSGSKISGMLFFLGAIIINPLFYKLVIFLFGKKLKKRFYIPALIVMFFAGVLTSNVTPVEKETVSENEMVQTDVKLSTSDDQVGGEKTGTLAYEDEMVSENNETVIEETPIVEGTLEVHIIDVGQGSSALLICDGEAMLIDAGNNDKGTTVQLYLTKHNVNELKYVIGTHPDADHIGGLDVIITKYDCGCIMMPDVENDTSTYRDVLDAIDYRNYKISIPKCGDSFTLGGAICTIIGPVDYSGDENDASIALKVEYGETSFIFSGDASSKAEGKMIEAGYDLSADVCVLGHHGSRTSSCAAWLDAICPTYAVISCGTNNSYGHPHEETLLALQSRDVKLYRTDEQGSVVITSDGHSLECSCEPSSSWVSGNNEVVDDITGQDIITFIPPVVGTTYVLNKGNMKYHKPECDSVKDILVKNREDVTLTENEVIAMGYDGCQNCIPAKSQVNETNDEEQKITISTSDYVLNTNTKKFHRPTCSSVSDIKSKNRQDVNCTRDEVISMGYDPCKRCNP